MELKWLARLPWNRRHPQLFALLRVAAGVFFLVVAALLVGYHAGSWWGPALLVAVAAVEFYVAFRLPRTVRALKAYADAS